MILLYNADDITSHYGAMITTRHATTPPRYIGYGIRWLMA